MAVIRRLESSPYTALHLKDVSETQELRSHPLAPILAPDETKKLPKSAPTTLILADPVAATFPIPIPLTADLPYDKDWDKDPDSIPAETDIRPLPLTPELTRHSRPVSDSQRELSLAELQSRAACDALRVCRPAPNNVRLNEAENA